MEHSLILFPVVALVALTFGIALWMGKLRFLAVRRGDLSPRYYELNRGGKVPDYLAKVSQNYDNLLELPILFYVLGCLLYVTDKVEPAQLVMAWLFVGSRYVHSYIHTTTNTLKSRMRVFLFGALLLMVMWLLFALRLFQS
jgi:hypothetical protein